MREIRICTGYTVHGKPVALLPSGADAVAECVPVYEIAARLEREHGRRQDDRRAAGATRAPTSSGSRRSPACRSRWSRRGRTATRRSCCTTRSTDARRRRDDTPGGTAWRACTSAGTSTTRSSSGSRSIVHESGYDFDQIICIARGGMRVGDVLSRIYETPLAILSTHSYAAEGGTIRGELVIAEHMTMTSPRLGDARAARRRHGRLGPHARGRGKGAAASAGRSSRRCKTAVLWWKACSTFKPDYYVDYLPTIRGSTSRSRSTTRCGPDELRARLDGCPASADDADTGRIGDTSGLPRDFPARRLLTERSGATLRMVDRIRTVAKADVPRRHAANRQIRMRYGRLKSGTRNA